MIATFQSILGEAHVITGPDLEPYLTEERGLYRGDAICALRPATTAQVSEIVKICAAQNVAVVPAGGRTGLVGGTIALGNAVIISLERMNAILDVDAINYTLTAQAGAILAHVQNAAQSVDRLFPLSLGAEGSCQIGGNISTNAGGVNVLRYGNMRDLVLGLEVVLPDGQIWNGLKSLRKDNTGLDLKHLFMGAEGTLGIITTACLKLFPRPKHLETAFFALNDLEDAPKLLALAREFSGDGVSACELIPRFGLEIAIKHGADIRDPLAQAYDWYLLLELSAAKSGPLRETLEALSEFACDKGLIADAVIAQSDSQRASFWKIRETIPEAQKREGGSIKHDVSVPVSKVPELIRRAILGVTATMPGIRPCPFGHVGDGNVHLNLTQPVGADRAAFLAQWPVMNKIIHDIVLNLDGSISAEHGIGLVKRDELKRTAQAVDLELQLRIKQAFDPMGIMNPGKIISRD